MLFNGKSPGIDRLHSEVIKWQGIRLVEVLYTIKDTRENLEVPVDWKDSQHVTIFKKEDRWDCSIYHRISLFSMPGKVFSHILLNKLLILAEDILPNVGTMDMTSSLQQIQKKCIEEMHWTEYTPLHDICWLQKSLWRCEQESSMKQPIVFRVPWRLYQTYICLSYRNESISQLKRRTLRTIWDEELNETQLCSCSHAVFDVFYGFVWCLH